MTLKTETPHGNFKSKNLHLKSNMPIPRQLSSEQQAANNEVIRSLGQTQTTHHELPRINSNRFTHYLRLRFASLSAGISAIQKRLQKRNAKNVENSAANGGSSSGSDSV